MPNKYIVLTIGPIYKTMLTAKRTRELWGASYLFSWIMKQMIRRLHAKGFQDTDFIVPYVDDAIFNTPPQGVGLFPDMLLIQLSEELTKKTFESALMELKLALSTELYNDNDKKNETPSVLGFVNDYFRFVYQEFEEKTDEKPIITAGKICGQLELRSRLNNQGFNPLTTLLDRASNSFLGCDGFGNKNHHFPSLVEIATKELETTNQVEYKKLWNEYGKKSSENDKEDKKDKAFIAALKSSPFFKERFCNYHKYIAIIKADGDKIGATIQGWNGNLRDFSKELYDFGISATQSIIDYGGVPIYLGGDDLLFFAPINNGDSDIFTLCGNLSKSFSQKFAVENPPTLSFGISISYYKYPLYSALEEADNLLYHAKELDSRNAVSWKVLQHSGQYFEERLNQNESVYQQFRTLLDSPTLEEEHLKSVVQHFRRTDPALWQIIVNIPTSTEGSEEDSSNPRALRIEAYFANFFNEKIHQHYKDFFETLGELVAASLPAPNTDKETVEAALKSIYAILRTIIFTKGYDLTDE